LHYPFGLSPMTYTYARYSLEYTLSAAEKHGFFEIEIWGGHPHAAVELLDEGYLKKLTDLLAKYKLTVSMFTPEQLAAPVSIGSHDPHIKDYSVRHFCRAVDAAAVMGAPRMLMTSGTVLADEDPKKAWDRAMDSLTHIARYGMERGVKIVLEPLAKEESPLLNSLPTLEKAYQELSPFRPEVMVDLVPMHLNQERLEDYFTVFGQDLSVIHFIDCDGKTIKHLIPGDGVIDFTSIMETIKARNFKGSVSLELGDSYHENPDQALVKSLEKVKQLALEVGYQ